MGRSGDGKRNNLLGWPITIFWFCDLATKMAHKMTETHETNCKYQNEEEKDHGPTVTRASSGFATFVSERHGEENDR